MRMVQLLLAFCAVGFPLWALAHPAAEAHDHGVGDGGGMLIAAALAGLVWLAVAMRRRAVAKAERRRG